MSTVFNVAQQGEAILTLRAAAVTPQEIGTAWLNSLTEAMFATMQAKNGVGIAAPQIYVSKRIIIVASRPNLRYPDAPEMDAVVMINPEVIDRSTQTILGEEGCLSVPDQRGQVARAEYIQLRYLTLIGETVEMQFQGFPARIVQHEIDHLDGILFVEHLNESRLFN